MIAAMHFYHRTKWRRAFTALVVILTINLCVASEPVELGGDNSGWRAGSTHGGVALFSRVRAGSSLKEFKAVGEIDAPTRATHAVLDDFENYTNFMPYTTECRLLKKDGDSLIAYQRLSPKIVSDRDYTLRVRRERWRGESGMFFLDRWEPANELGPAVQPGVLRVRICEGSWLLEPTGSNKTRGTYSIYTDSGGTIPAFIANKISEIGIRKLFAAIRKQVRDPKYHVTDR